MALLKMGAIVTQVSGKIGGQTFGTGQSGQYIKNTGSYINKLSTSRSVVNSNLAYLSNTWRQLTDAEKNSWSAAAPNFPYVNRLGNSKTYNGFNLYMKFNGNRLLWNASPVKTAPVPFTFYEFKCGTSEITPSLMTLSFEFTYPSNMYAIYASNPSSAGSSYNKKGLRLIRVIEGIADNLFDVEIRSDYIEVFGDYKPGQKIFFKVFQYEKATGIKSGFYKEFNSIVSTI